MNLSVLDEQKKLEDNVLNSELENSTSIEDLKGKIDEYLKNNLENLELKVDKSVENILEKSPLGNITIEKSAIKDIDLIKENLEKNLDNKIEKIEKNIEEIKDNIKEKSDGLISDKSFIQKGVETVYDFVKDAALEKVLGKAFERAKSAFETFSKTAVGERIINGAKEFFDKGMVVLKNVGNSMGNLIKGVFSRNIAK